MPITKLNTFEGVPIGKENFEGYTEYLSNLVARSNPFIETNAADFNKVIALGAGQVKHLAASDSLIENFKLSYNNGNYNYFAYKFRDMSESEYSPATIVINASDYQSITPPSLTDGNHIVKVSVSADSGVTTYGNFSILVNGSDVSGALYAVSGTDIANSVDFIVFESLDLLNTDSLNIDFDYISGSGNLNFDVDIYKYEVWSSDSTYLINFDLNNPTFTASVAGRVDVYYGDESEVVSATDFSGLTLLDSIDISANNDSLGSLVFKPNESFTDGSIIFVIQEGEAEFTVDLSLDVFKLGEDDIIHLTANSLNSYAFLTDDTKTLYSIQTRYLESPYATPSVASWEVPLGSVSEIPLSPGVVGYGFSKSLIPPVFARFSSGDFENAKDNIDVGEYEKGFMLTTINGIPQVQDGGIYSSDGFFDNVKLQSSDLYLFKSLRLGSEYPSPVYSSPINHQFAKPTIEGFTHVNSSVTSGESLGSEYFNNTLFFPYTDFLISPSLILVYYNSNEDSESYYYIPRDTDFSNINQVRENHYKVTDLSSGEVKFNFNLEDYSNIESSDRFWIVSAEQLVESTTNNVTDYFSTYGSLYSPTANFDVTTKILSFNPSEILNVDLDTSLPSLNLIPSTKIISSGGGPIISDAESEFSNLTLYGFSYPGLVDADGFVRLQANKYEPDVVKFYYYAGTVSKYVAETDIPFSTRVSLVNNNISWFNRGINDITYDPVSRAVNSDLAVLLNTVEVPPDTNGVNDLKRRSSFSAFVGTIAPGDTNFMRTDPAPGFAYGNVSNQIDFFPADAGDLLVGTGLNSSPSVLLKGNSGEVLTATNSGLSWDSISTAAWTQLIAGGTDVIATDSNKLSITANQIDISLGSTVTATDITTNLSFDLSDNIVVSSLVVSDSISLPSTSVSSGTYGGSNSVPRIVIDEDGRISDASDVSISTESWKFISDRSSQNTAGVEDTLYIDGTTNQIEVAVDGIDSVSISLSNVINVSDHVNTPFFNFSSFGQPGSVKNGSVWSTASDVKIRLNSSNKTFAFVGEHTHSTSDLISGILPVARGGTGFGSISSGHVLIGNSSGGFSSNVITGSGPVNVASSSGSVQISVNNSTNNNANTLVYRDNSGNFSAGTITADLSGNASTATTLETPRTINGVSFDGSQNITISASTSTITTNDGLTGGPFDGTVNKTFSVDNTVVRTSGNQSIGGVKTFSSTISGSITGNAGSVTNGVYTIGNQIIDGTKTFSSTISGSITGDAGGNASTATKLKNARLIGGTSFDGTSNIDVALSTESKKVSNTAAAGSSVELVRGNMASNDQFRILVGGGSDNGYVEFSTADNGTEPIYVRQYSGVFDTIKRTLTLLDGSGNTSFPGNIYLNDSIIHTGDGNTYFGFPDNNQFRVTTGGLNSLSIVSGNTTIRDLKIEKDLNFASTATPNTLTNGDFWFTSTEIKARLNDHTKTIAFVDDHTHSADDIDSGTLPYSRGGTGSTSYTAGQLLIGHPTSGLVKSTLTGSSDITITNGNGSISISTSATNNNTKNRIVKRDANGNFSAGKITADLGGSVITVTGTLKIPVK